MWNFHHQTHLFIAEYSSQFKGYGAALLVGFVTPGSFSWIRPYVIEMIFKGGDGIFPSFEWLIHQHTMSLGICYKQHTVHAVCTILTGGVSQARKPHEPLMLETPETINVLAFRCSNVNTKKGVGKKIIHKEELFF